MKDNYFKLLKYEEELKKTDKFLRKKDPEKSDELFEYEIRITEHFRWKEKDQYVLVLNSFLENQINVNQYIDQLFEVKTLIEKSVAELKTDFEKLKSFEVAPFSKEFSRIIGYLFSDIQVFEPDDGLRNRIKEFLPKIQDY